MFALLSVEPQLPAPRLLPMAGSTAAADQNLDALFPTTDLLNDNVASSRSPQGKMNVVESLDAPSSCKCSVFDSDASQAPYLQATSGSP